MQVTLTAVGPDNVGLADPLIHYVAGVGANIHEIQMYDRDDAHVFAMMMRVDWPEQRESVATLRQRMNDIGRVKGLTVRTWSRDAGSDTASGGDHASGLRKPRLAVCGTFRPETPSAVLEAVADGSLRAEVPLLLSNREKLRPLADQHGVRFENVGDTAGKPDNERFVRLLDEHAVDYVILARYMQIIPPRLCWEYAGGRIINLHHGLLPPFPGFRPYHDAYERRMLAYGATCHFIVPELDAGDQTINQRCFTVDPGTPLPEIIRRGEQENEPACLLEGVRRVVDREVELHFHRVARVGIRDEM